MNIKSFLKLVEIQTKVASVIPFSLATLYAYYQFNTFSLTNALLMFSSMFIFDMTVTAINNYMDYQTAIKKQGYGYETHNAVVAYNLNPKTVRITIYTMLSLATLLGLLLVLNTNIVVLLLGGICFLIGICYSWGPLPISRTPFGELFSGATMGFLLPLIAIYIHIFNHDVITLTLSQTNLTFSLNLNVILSIFMITIPLMSCIANIMLANNLCDYDDDLANKRLTLPIAIGKQKALYVFNALYGFSYFAILVCILLDLLPLTSALTFLTLIPVIKHIRLFNTKQSKQFTFVLSVKNFIILNAVYVLTILLSLILTW
ncbi:MAG TPA: 1,4-dihydroxy-2-naphthoate polyprenyltransferase [Firmicutes bacterium]|nr:1,4-dihydroxy-2-naphthoate polyprenyltransferase [Bacillota bacterium]